MTTNLIRSQENRQNIQLHPKDDPNIAFYHTFELLLSQKDKQVRIVDDNQVVGKIPLKAFWNSQPCDDHNYYGIHISDMNDSSEKQAWIIKNPLLKKTYHEQTGKNAKDAVEIIGEIVDQVTNAVRGTITDSRSFTTKEIPELEKNHRVRYAREMEFKFVKKGSDCEVLTVQGANTSNSDISIDLPSKACVHTDDGKLQCSNLGSVREIKKSEGSTKHYMTMTRDKDNHYKYYFSDQDGKSIDNLEFRLSDIRITNPAMLKILQSDHRVNKLHQKSQDIDEKLTQHVDRDADPSPSAVAELLVNQKADQLGRAVLNIKDVDQKSKLAVELASNDVLKEGVKDLLKGDSDFKTAVKGKTGSQGLRGEPGAKGESPTPESVADELVTNS
ncbi:hypothetical protein NOX90_03640 [Wolbachia endosymbiont of Anurida maritima]|uniref:hypothetical protein n=1 Tax=Wolbachia endosymbiont of Anurida maritima TaxID=2850562 RepID=UPI0035CFBF83